MQAGIILSAREKATRLPGKVLKPLGDSTSVTQFLLRRLKTATRSHTVVLATSDDPRDQSLCDIAAEERVPTFRGSADDKLLRYRDAALAHGLEFVVIVDGDDPFVSVSHIDRIIDHAIGRDVDFVMFANLPLGATGFGLRTRALERICKGRDESNTEVWGDLFRSDPTYVCAELHEDNPALARPSVRMTLDYREDYEFLTEVVGGLRKAGQEVDFESVMAYLSDHPQVIEINRNVQVAYEAHLIKSTEDFGVNS